MNDNIKEFILLSTIVAVIDLSWLYYYMSGQFSSLIKTIQGDKINIKIVPSILSYFFLSFCLYYFIIKEGKLNRDAFILGICVYGVFEATNMAIFNNWDIKIFIIDTLWGGVLYVLSYIIYKRLSTLIINSSL